MKLIKLGENNETHNGVKETKKKTPEVKQSAQLFYYHFPRVDGVSTTQDDQSHNPKKASTVFGALGEKTVPTTTTTTAPMFFFPSRVIYLEELVEAKRAVLMTLAEETLFRFQFDAKHWRLLPLNSCCVVASDWKQQQLLLLGCCRDGRRQKCAIRAHNHVADGS